jgi:hypothetical protein
MFYWMTRMEREANDYWRGLRTHSELVWDAWTTAKEDSHGIADPVEALRAHLSASAFAAAQAACRQELAAMGIDATGFLPHRFLRSDTDMELSPEFVPRTFIERLATEVQNDRSAA